ncbi:hypothetical protein IAF42_19985, partial [Acinetobacter baumannii]|nr:hypothetical protein [Acinetobacter baumannii]
KEGQEVSAKPYQAQPANSQGAAPNAAKPAQSGKPQAEQKAASCMDHPYHTTSSFIP